MPDVSIVVPCYNGGRFLDGLIESLAAQTYRNFEVIIVDDGSTERATRDKLTEVEARCVETVHVIRQDNRGLPAARNAGFRAARAALVLPLDCDDRLLPAFLERAVNAVHSTTNAGFAFAHMRLSGVLSGVMQRHFDRFDQLFLNQLPYALLMRKSLWREVGGYDESMLDGYEDWEFNLRVMKTGAVGVEIGEPLFVYNVHPSGMLLSKSSRMHGALWRRIREKHADLYRPRSLFEAYRSSGPRRKVSVPVALGLLNCARILPDSWFGALFRRLLVATQRRRRRREQAVESHHVES